MNKTKLMFFVSCPECKRKFGVEPKYILMYLSRIIDHYKGDDKFGKLPRISEMLQAAQDDVRKTIKKES